MMTTPLDHPQAGGASIRKQVPDDSLLVILKVAASKAEKGSESGLGWSAPEAQKEPKADISKMQAKSARILAHPPVPDTRSTLIGGPHVTQKEEACKGSEAVR